jgi:FkbM family methyltransferase
LIRRIIRRLRRGFGPPPREPDHVIRECRRLIAGGVFYDVGANIGLVSEDMLGHAGRIIAIEANPVTFAQLQQRLGARAICVNTLIGPEGEERIFLHNTLEHGGSASVAPGDTPKGHDYLKPTPMQARSLDSIAREHGQPDLIKIDCEGFEMQILASASEVLSRRPAVVLEFNALCLSNFGRVNPRDAIDRILATFPRVERITETGLAPVTDPYGFITEHILQRHSIDNLVCTWNQRA